MNSPRRQASENFIEECRVCWLENFSTVINSNFRFWQQLNQQRVWIDSDNNFCFVLTLRNQRNKRENVAVSLEDRKIILCSILNEKKRKKAWTSHTVKQYYSSFYERFLLQPYFPFTIDFSSTPPLRSLLLSSQQFSAESDECVIRTCETTDALLSQFITLNDANALNHRVMIHFWYSFTCRAIAILSTRCVRVRWQQIATMFSLFCIISFSSFLYISSWLRQQCCQQDRNSSVMWCDAAMGMFSERKIISKFQIFFGSCLRALLQNCRSC